MSISWNADSPIEAMDAQWVRNPITKEKETIVGIWTPKAPIKCPNCRKEDHHTLVATTQHAVLYCKDEKLYFWKKR